ncbi:ABC transporter ATP-binding protein, partial [Streptomyces cavourensis]|nr:ABC transporter ATP-binding protein [Streptomyces cavourensis]
MTTTTDDAGRTPQADDGEATRTGTTAATAPGDGGRPALATAAPGSGAGPAPGKESAEAPDPFDQDDLPAPPGATRALLFSLLRPMRGRVAVVALLLVLQQAAVQAGPLLVAYAIDSGVPAFRDHDYGPLIAVAVGYLLCSAGAGVFQYAFIRGSAR